MGARQNGYLIMLAKTARACCLTKPTHNNQMKIHYKTKPIKNKGDTILGYQGSSQKHQVTLCNHTVQQ